MAKKTRTLGEIMFDVEDIVSEIIDGHDLQKGEVMALISNYIDVHYPGAIEEYEDGSHPVYFYGPKKQLKKLSKGMR